MGQSFNELILQCVESGLLILGESSRHVVLWKWETEKKLSVDDIPSHLAKFVNFLEEMFGVGSKLVEEAIAKEVGIKFGLENDLFRLTEAVQRAREHFSD